MIWNSWSDFWAMGGYGVYVWGSFGVTAALMLIEMVWVKQARAKGQQLGRKVQTGYDSESGQPLYEEETLDFQVLPQIVLVAASNFAPLETRITISPAVMPLPTDRKSVV